MSTNTATETADTPPPEPATMSQAECYQRLRAHLAFLQLPAAAEALPAVLDQARQQKLSPVDGAHLNFPGPAH